MQMNSLKFSTPIMLELSNFFINSIKKNGELNEDEQILLLSAVKEKMQRAADELVKIQEYDLFKSLMDKIRFI